MSSAMSAAVQIADYTELKTAFAMALLKNPENPFVAAFAVTPDTGLALQMANLWVTDKFVVTEKLRLLKENGERAFLPTKEDQAKEIYKMANDSKIDEETRLKAHRLYAEIMGHIEKPAPGGTVNVLNQGVMIVKDHGTDDAWENSAVEQQRRLIINADSGA